MTKKYLAGAIILGSFMIGWAWLNTPDSVTSNNNSPTAEAAPQTAAPVPASKDVSF